MRSLPKIVKQGSRDVRIQPYHFSADFGREIEEEEEADQPEHAEDSRKNGLHEKTEKVLAEALAQAEQILDTARAEAVNIREGAREAGYTEGFEMGRKAGFEEAFEENKKAGDLQRQEVEADIREFLSLAQMEKKRLLDSYLEDLKNLAVAVAEKVIQVSLKSSGEVIKRMIISSTDTLKRSQWVKIYIAKCDAVFLAENDAALLKALSHLSDNVKIVAMEGEESGTCIIELPDEIIDASVTSQMENIKEIISNARV